jgi:hypothetical protein
MPAPTNGAFEFILVEPGEAKKADDGFDILNWPTSIPQNGPL